MGFVEFDYDSKYWQVDHVDTSGYRQNGYRLGVHGWANSNFTFAPKPLSFGYDTILDEDVIEWDTTIANTEEFGASYGWPFLCITQNILVRKTRQLEAGMNFATVDAVKWTTVDISPQPKWYYEGIRTGIDSFWPFYSIPIAVQPLHFLANTLIYSVFVLGIQRVWIFIRTYRRKRKGLCLVCGYAVEDLGTCPECGVERVGDRG